MLLSRTWELYESDKKIERFSPQTLKAHSSNLSYLSNTLTMWNLYMALRQDKDPAIFVTERHPHRMSIGQMRYIIKRILSRAGINKETAPQLCHTPIEQRVLRCLFTIAPVEQESLFLWHIIILLRQKPAIMLAFSFFTFHLFKYYFLSHHFFEVWSLSPYKMT